MNRWQQQKWRWITCHGGAAVRRGVHCPMEHIQGFTRSNVTIGWVPVWCMPGWLTLSHPKPYLKVILSYLSTYDEWRRPDETAQKAQTTWQTTSLWCWSRSPLQRREFDESMPPKGWVAFHIFFPMSLSKRFNWLEFSLFCWPLCFIELHPLSAAAANKIQID